MKLPRFSFRSDPLRDARKILGPECIINYAQGRKALKARRFGEPKLDYDPSLFEICHEQNQEGEMWRLFCRTNQPITEVKKKRPKEFCHSAAWDVMPRWMTTSVEPAYRLINLKPHRYDEPYLSVVGAPVDRSWLVTVVQALVAFKIIHGQVYLKDQFHGADEEGGIIPLVGCYDDEGMLITSLDPLGVPLYQSIGQLGTVLCCVPQLDWTKTAA
jgi:hypothetical protein